MFAQTISALQSVAAQAMHSVQRAVATLMLSARLSLTARIYHVVMQVTSKLINRINSLECSHFRAPKSTIYVVQGKPPQMSSGIRMR